MANWDIRLGYKNLAWFNANPNLILKSGQHVYLSDTANAGQFKMGDGITVLSVLSWYGGSADTYKVMVTAADTTPNYLSSKILVGGIITKTVQNPGGNENILLSATETDPVFGAWLAGPPNVSIFTNDAGYVTGPAGVDTNIQYNDSSAFGGDNGFTYGKNTHIVTINNPLTVDGTYTTTLKLTSNTAYTTSIINKLVKSGGSYSGGTYLCVVPGSGVDYTATGFLAVLTGNGGKFLTATNKDDTTKGTYFRIYDATGSVPEITLSADSSIFSFINCHLSIGKNSIPTAVLHLPAGTATASTAPLKLTTGTALAVIEDGALEYHSSHLYFSIGAVRYQLDQQAGAAHNILSATHSDTLADTVVRGDILVGNSTPKWSRKAKGAAGVLVTFDANDVIYTTATYPATVALGSVLVANALNTVTALTETVGTKYLKNAAGVISWDTVSGGAPGGASGDLQMNDGSGGFAYGGLNYTAAGVLMKYTKDMVFYPTADSTTAFLFSNAARNDGVYYDSTNNRFVGKGGTTAILQVSHSAGISLLYGSLGLMAGGTSATLAYSSVVGVWVFNDRIEFKDANGTGVIARLSYKGLSLGAWAAFDASAHLHIAGCSTAAGSAPIKIDSGTLMTNPENGAIESDGTHLWWTDSGGNRKQLDN